MEQYYNQIYWEYISCWEDDLKTTITPPSDGKCGLIEIEITKNELIQEGEELAQKSSLHCGFFEACKRVRNGELDGTLFASKIERIRFLLEDFS